MKKILFIGICLLFCVAVFGQNDLDFKFHTAAFTVFKQTVDSVATDSLKAIAKPGDVVQNVIIHDTVHVTQYSLRYIQKEGNKLTVYDPNNPKNPVNYAIEFAGWLKSAPNYVLKYNLFNKEGQLFGAISVDLYSQEMLIATPMTKILYTNRQ